MSNPSRIENRETVREIYVKLEIERINEIKELKQANNKRIKITKNRKSKWNNGYYSKRNKRNTYINKFFKTSLSINKSSKRKQVSEKCKKK